MRFYKVIDVHLADPIGICDCDCLIDVDLWMSRMFPLCLYPQTIIKGYFWVDLICDYRDLVWFSGELVDGFCPFREEGAICVAVCNCYDSNAHGG